MAELQKQKTMKQIGPHLHVQDDFVPNMQDAYQADNERGSHHLNNWFSERHNAEWPTVIAMAALIEKERDELKRDRHRLNDVVITRLRTLAVCANLKCDSCKALIAETIADIQDNPPASE